MMKNWMNSLAVWSVTILMGCGVNETKNQKPPAPDLTAIAGDSSNSIKYANVRDTVFTSCTHCHGPTAQKGGVRLDSYADIKTNLDDIVSDIESKSMPRNSALTEDQLATFSKWIAQGTPEI